MPLETHSTRKEWSHPELLALCGGCYVYIHYVVGTSLADVNPRELHLGIPDSEPQVAVHFGSTFKRVLKYQEGYNSQKLPQGYSDRCFITKLFYLVTSSL